MKEDYSRAHDDRQPELFDQIRNSKLNFNDARIWGNIFRYMISCGVIENYANVTGQKNISVLDIGCSEATLYGFAKNNYSFVGNESFEYTGVDVRQNVLDNAKELYPEIITVRHDLNDDVPLEERFGDKKFDIIFAQQVLEHVGYEDAIRMLKSIKFLLKDYGQLVLSAPNPDKDSGQQFIVPTEILNDPNFVNGHIYEFSLDEVFDIFNDIGLYAERQYGCMTYSTHRDLKERTHLQKAFSDFSKSMSYGFFVATSITAFPEKANNYLLICRKKY